MSDCDAACTERKNSGLIEAKIERWRSGRLIENAQLFGRRGEGVAPAKQRESHLTAAFLRETGNSATADAVACSIEDDEMGRIPPGSQDGQGLGTNFHRFATAIYMVIVIGGFDKGSGEHGEMPLPSAGSVCRIDRSPSVVGSIQP
jgi:hypothetical protein